MRQHSEAHSAAPLVTVVIPVYNGEKYLDQALVSALSQDYPRVEVLVVDDGSENAQAIAEICARYEKTQVKLIRKENGGVSSALNLGIRAASGEFFCWLSHDDLFLPGKISHQVDVFRRRGLPDTSIVYGDYQLIDQSGRSLGASSLSGVLDACKSRLAPLERALVNGCTVFMKLDALRTLGPFDESLRCTQDFDMWLRALDRGFELHFDSTPVVATRIHAEQTSAVSPLVSSENAVLWRRIGAAVAEEQRDREPQARLRHLMSFVEFVDTAPYLAGIDFSGLHADIRIETERVRAEMSRRRFVILLAAIRVDQRIAKLRRHVARSTLGKLLRSALNAWIPRN